jgi:hypothetical protein
MKMLPSLHGERLRRHAAEAAVAAPQRHLADTR